MIKIIMSVVGIKLTADSLFFLVRAIQEPVVALGEAPPLPPPILQNN